MVAKEEVAQSITLKLSEILASIFCHHSIATDKVVCTCTYIQTYIISIFFIFIHNVVASCTRFYDAVISRFFIVLYTILWHHVPDSTMLYGISLCWQAKFNTFFQLRTVFCVLWYSTRTVLAPGTFTRIDPIVLIHTFPKIMNNLIILYASPF